MQKQHNLATNEASKAVRDSRIDVALNDEGVTLRLSTWTEGLGWCGQKTIEVDAAQLDELQRALTAARLRLAHRRAMKKEAGESNAVIQFPQLSN